MSASSLDQRFADTMGQLLGPEFPKEIGLAVSGGGDSMAMLALAHIWARVWGVGLRIVTIDHGLRPESKDEAALVAREAAALGWPHDTLHWQWDGQGNFHDAARRARLDLIHRWRGTIEHVLMAHTADDVAETFLIRLARGSGVEGLAAMRAKRRVAQGFWVLRPCLGISRDALRHHARALHVPWVDDPSNDDPKYDRARARKLLGSLKELDVDAADLVGTADRLRRASEALLARMLDVADQVLVPCLPGGVRLDRDGFARVERDTQLRLLAAACMWIGGEGYRPRASSLEALLDALLAGGSGTLMGVQAQTGAYLELFRELNPVRALVAPYGDASLWDGRWRMDGPEVAGAEIRALGEAVARCSDWRETGISRAALMATPSLWLGDTLISAPIAGFGTDWHANMAQDFTSYLLSH